MRTLLIQAPTDRRTFDISQAVPPIGLECIAAYIEDLSEVKIVDAKMFNLSHQAILQEIEAYQPDVIGFTLLTGPMTQPTLRLAETIKKAYPKLRLVVGGHQATFIPDHLLQSGWVDIVVRGEGELTARDLWQKGSPEGVLGVSYMQDGQAVHNPPRPFSDDFSARRPARHLIDRTKYHMFGMRMEGVESSRGCPYSCTFCSLQKFSGRKWRARTPESVIAEVSYLAETYGTNTVFFVDDNFTLDMERVRKICQLSLDAGLRVRYFCQSRVDSLIRAPDVAELMARAGFFLILLGIENTDQTLLDEVSKGTTGRQSEQAVKLLHQYDIAVWGNFILGFPSETRQTIMNTLEAAKLLDVELARFAVLTPYPGTDLFEDTRKRNGLLTQDWDLFDADHSVMQLPHMTTEEFYTLRKEVYKGYYLRPAYISRHLRPAQSQRDQLREIMLKASWQGFIGGLGRPDILKDWLAVFEGCQDLVNAPLAKYLNGQSARILIDSELGSLVLDVQNGQLAAVDTEATRFNCRVMTTNEVLNRLLTLMTLDPMSAFMLGMAHFEGTLLQFHVVQVLLSSFQNVLRAIPRPSQPIVLAQLNTVLESAPALQNALTTLRNIRLQSDGLAVDLRIEGGKVSYWGMADLAIPADVPLALQPDVMLSLLTGDSKPLLTLFPGQQLQSDGQLEALLRGIVLLAQQQSVVTEGPL